MVRRVVVIEPQVIITKLATQGPGTKVDGAAISPLKVVSGALRGVEEQMLTGDLPIDGTDPSVGTAGVEDTALTLRRFGADKDFTNKIEVVVVC